MLGVSLPSVQLGLIKKEEEQVRNFYFSAKLLMWRLRTWVKLTLGDILN